MTNLLGYHGIISVAEMAEELGTDGASLEKALVKNGIPILKLSSRYNKKLVLIKDIHVKP